MSTKTYRILAAVCAVLTLLCLAMIFRFGTQNSKASMAESKKVVEKVKEVAKAVENVDLADTEKKSESLTSKVRKSAHAIEFFVLGVCSTLTVVFFFKGFDRKYPFLPSTLCFAAAVADEYIQGKIKRSSRVTDIVIDVCGAVAGIILVAVIFGIITLINKKRNKNA